MDLNYLKNQLAAAKTQETMFAGDVENRTKHLACLTDEREKQLYGDALKGAQKSLSDATARLNTLQGTVDALSNVADSKPETNAS